MAVVNQVCLKALLRDKGLIITGEIITPELSKIGYLDQHYANLAPELSASRNYCRYSTAMDNGRNPQSPK